MSVRELLRITGEKGKFLALDEVRLSTRIVPCVLPCWCLGFFDFALKSDEGEWLEDEKEDLEHEPE